MHKIETKFIVKAGIIAAIYFVLTVIQGHTSFNAVQSRLSEAMTILPFFEEAAVPGLFIGCFIANIFGGLGFFDVVFGSIVTLVAAYLTSKMPNKYTAVLPPIMLNAIIVPIWVSKISHLPYLVTVGTIGFGEFISAGILGLILAEVFERISNNY